MKKLEKFKGKIIKVGRGGFGPEYANDFIFPDGVRKEIAYVDNNGIPSYIVGMCEDNSCCYFCGMSASFEADIRKNINITEITDVLTKDEMDSYINEVDHVFHSILEDKGRPPFSHFPLPIIDRIEMDEMWKNLLIEEQKS